MLRTVICHIEMKLSDKNRQSSYLEQMISMAVHFLHSTVFYAVEGAKLVELPITKCAEEKYTSEHVVSCSTTSARAIN